MATDAESAARDFYSVDLIFFDVVIDGAPVNVDYPGRASHSQHFHVFPATRAPDFVSENDGRS